MRPVSAAFLAAITAEHEIAVEIEVLRAGVFVQDLEAISGSVTLDVRSAVRGRGSLTIVDDGSLGLVPVLSSDPLAPYGNEIQVRRGVRFPDGTTELVSLGVLGIQDVEVRETAGGAQISLDLLDRAQRVIDARFEEPYQVAAGTNFGTAIEAVIEAGYPGLTFNLPTITATTPQLVAEEGDDRWAFAQEMAKSLGLLLYFDGDGEVTAETIASAIGNTNVDLVEGENGVLTDAGSRWTREGAYNRVIATGENTGASAPVRGVATDDNPQSPTYYYGAFGKVPAFYSSQFITTADQAVAAAGGILNKQLGTTKSVDFGAVVNPALEPNDVVRITREVLGVDENHVIDSVTIPLDVESVMSGQTRATQVT